MHDWLESPPGLLVRRFEAAALAEHVSDVFGYHAMQLGLPQIDGLQANRMPKRWLALGPSDVFAAAHRGDALTQVACDFTALPFDDNSLDLIVLPHSLEWCGEAASCLREVERVLRPEGRLVLTGFNPLSWWGLRQLRQRLWLRLGGQPTLFLPEGGEFIRYQRLRDWLRLLSFEVESAQFGVYEPPFASQVWLDRMAWFAKLGARWWPAFGAVYVVGAVKRVRGSRVIKPALRAAAYAAAPVAVVRRAPSSDAQRDELG